MTPGRLKVDNLFPFLQGYRKCRFKGMSGLPSWESAFARLCRRFFLPKFALFPNSVAHHCCDPLSRYTVSPTQCRSKFLQLSPMPPKTRHATPLSLCRGEVCLQKRKRYKDVCKQTSPRLQGGVAATLTPTAPHFATKFRKPQTWKL